MKIKMFCILFFALFLNRTFAQSSTPMTGGSFTNDSIVVKNIEIIEIDKPYLILKIDTIYFNWKIGPRSVICQTLFLTDSANIANLDQCDNVDEFLYSDARTYAFFYDIYSLHERLLPKYPIDSFMDSIIRITYPWIDIVTSMNMRNLGFIDPLPAYPRRGPLDEPFNQSKDIVIIDVNDKLYGVYKYQVKKWLVITTNIEILYQTASSFSFCDSEYKLMKDSLIKYRFVKIAMPLKE